MTTRKERAEALYALAQQGDKATYAKDVASEGEALKLAGVVNELAQADEVGVSVYAFASGRSVVVYDLLHEHCPTWVFDEPDLGLSLDAAPERASARGVLAIAAEVFGGDGKVFRASDLP